DLEQRDARRELEHEGVAGLRKDGEELRDLPAVPRSIRRIATRDAPARMLVPARGLEALASLLEVTGEERGPRRGGGCGDRREPIDARREDGLNGLGQRDLLDGGGGRARTALAAQETAFDERADDLLDEEGITTGAGFDPGAERRKGGVGPEPVVEQRRGVVRGEGRQRETLDPCGPCGPILGPRGREQQRSAVGRLRSQ